VSGYRFLPHTPPRLPQDDGLSRGRDLLELLRSRRSVRFFSPDPVPREMIETAVATAGTAPSGANQQPWTFVAVSDPETKRRIRLAAEEEERKNYEGRFPERWLDDLAPLGTGSEKPYLEIAPWLVVVFRATTGPDGEQRYYTQESVGLACGMFFTACHAMGLATLCHTPNPMRFLNEILARPDREKPYMLVPVGYPAPDCVVPDITKKALEEILVVVGDR